LNERLRRVDANLDADLGDFLAMFSDSTKVFFPTIRIVKVCRTILFKYTKNQWHPRKQQ
jgi:hypothetical protein